MEDWDGLVIIHTLIHITNWEMHLNFLLLHGEYLQTWSSSHLCCRQETATSIRNFCRIASRKAASAVVCNCINLWPKYECNKHHHQISRFRWLTQQTLALITTLKTIATAPLTVPRGGCLWQAGVGWPESCAVSHRIQKSIFPRQQASKCSKWNDGDQSCLPMFCKKS